MIFCAV